MSQSQPLRFSPTTAGYLYVTAAGVLWGIQGPISKYCQIEGVAPLEVAFWRASFGCLCFFLHGALTRSLNVPLKRIGIFCAFGLYAVGLQFGAMQIAVRESGAALASVLLYTAPVGVAVLARIFFGETLTCRKIVSLVFALAGVVLICLSGGGMPDKDISPLGVGVGLLTGFIYATIVIFYSYWKRFYGTASVYPFMLMAGAAVLFCFIDVSLDKSLPIWVALFSLGSLTCYGAFYAQGKSLIRLSPVRVAVLCNLEPVVSTIVSWLWWDERFGTLGWAGCFLVIGAMFYLSSGRE